MRRGYLKRERRLRKSSRAKRLRVFSLASTKQHDLQGTTGGELLFRERSLARSQEGFQVVANPRSRELYRCGNILFR